MGAEQAGQTAYQAQQSGGAPGESFLYGTAAGLIEAVTEKLPLDNLFRLGRGGARGVKNKLVQVAKQIGIEASEETVSQLASTVADIAIMGDKSGFQQYKAQLIAQGYTERDAEMEALFQYFIKNPAVAGVGGGLSGGLTSTGATFIGNFTNERADSSAPTGQLPQGGAKAEAKATDTAGLSTQSTGESFIENRPLQDKGKTRPDLTNKEIVKDWYDEKGTSEASKRSATETAPDSGQTGPEMTNPESQKRGIVKTADGLAVNEDSLQGARERLDTYKEMASFADTPESLENVVNAQTEQKFSLPSSGEIADVSNSGKPYSVTVDPKAQRMLVGKTEMTPETLSIIENLMPVIENATYSGSGAARQTTIEGKSYTVPYDRFEVLVTTGGERYVVTFDVAKSSIRAGRELRNIEITKAPESHYEEVRRLYDQYAPLEKSAPSETASPELATAEQKGYTGDAPGREQAAEPDALGKEITSNRNGDAASKPPTEGAGELGKITDGGNNAQFTYKNNPMENPKAGKDIIEDPKAMYGYSPNPLSERIGRFADFDWTNKDVVSRAREARLQYHKDNESMYNIVKQ